MNQKNDLGDYKQIKVTNQCFKARNKGNKMLGIINQNVICREAISKPYNNYVKPVLEYCARLYSLFKKRHSYTRESTIYCIAIKMIFGYLNLRVRAIKRD